MSSRFPFAISRVSIILEAASLTCKPPLVWNQRLEYCPRLQGGVLHLKETMIFNNVSSQIWNDYKDLIVGLISNEKNRFSQTGLSNVSEISNK